MLNIVTNPTVTLCHTQNITYGPQPPQLRSQLIKTHGVPNLELDLLPLYVDHPGPELHPDSQVMNWLEPFVCELKQQA